MKSILFSQISLFLISLLVFLSACGTKTKSYYPDGSIQSELSYKGKELNGVSKWWFSDGKLQMECTYKNNELDGLMTRWHANGARESEGTYKKNLKNGKLQRWDEQGKLLEEANYLNDTLEGLYKLYHKNGKLYTSGNYGRGLYQGEWQWFDEEGNLVGEGVFEKGTGTKIVYNVLGGKNYETPYVANKRHGVEKWYSVSGEVVKEVVFDMDTEKETSTYKQKVQMDEKKKELLSKKSKEIRKL